MHKSAGGDILSNDAQLYSGSSCKYTVYTLGNEGWLPVFQLTTCLTFSYSHRLNKAKTISAELLLNKKIIKLLKEASERFGDLAFLDSLVVTDQWNNCVFWFDITTFLATMT